MSDKIALQVNGKRIEHFLSYTVEADIYTADDAFSLELSNPETEIKTGMKCELYVNDTLELTGLIDRVNKSYDKAGTKLKVEGRDLMGILVDSYCEEFVDVQGKTVKQLAEMLIGPNKKTGRPAIPFINRHDIIYQQNIVGKLKGKKQTVSQPITGFVDTPQKISKIEPGMTIFEVLRTYAASCGFMFWMEYRKEGPRFVFGRPMAIGDATYTLTCSKSGTGNNVLEGEQVDDISKRYSRVIVISQGQGHDEDGPDTHKVNSKAIKVDKGFPFYKTFVAKLTNDSQKPPLHARLLMEKQRHDGMQMHYKVARHSQGDRNWAINTFCKVKDEVLGIDQVYLIFGRIFELTKQGAFTRLKLGPPGLIA